MSAILPARKCSAGISGFWSPMDSTGVPKSDLSSPPPRLHRGGSRGDAVVVNASARVSGRQSRFQWPIISVAPDGAFSSSSFFFPWLTPWATFCRRYAACSGYASESLDHIGRHSSVATRLASARFFSPCCALARRMRKRGSKTESRGLAGRSALLAEGEEARVTRPARCAGVS